MGVRLNLSVCWWRIKHPFRTKGANANERRSGRGFPFYGLLSADFIVLVPISLFDYIPNFAKITFLFGGLRNRSSSEAQTQIQFELQMIQSEDTL